MNTRSPKLHLHTPSILKRLGERLGFREISPADIVPAHELGNLYNIFPDLAGDENIGPGNDGGCQSYSGDPFWWRRFFSDLSKRP